MKILGPLDEARHSAEYAASVHVHDQPERMLGAWVLPHLADEAVWYNMPSSAALQAASEDALAAHIAELAQAHLPRRTPGVE